MTNKKQIGKILMLLSSLPKYPEAEMDLIIDVYHLVLRDFDGEELKAAAAGRAGTAARVHNMDIPNHETTQLVN